MMTPPLSWRKMKGASTSKNSQVAFFDGRDKKRHFQRMHRTCKSLVDHQTGLCSELEIPSGNAHPIVLGICLYILLPRDPHFVGHSCQFYASILEAINFHQSICRSHFWMVGLAHGWIHVHSTHPNICIYIYIYIWINYNISLTWIKAIWGWFPLPTMIPVRSS